MPQMIALGSRFSWTVLPGRQMLSWPCYRINTLRFVTERSVDGERQFKMDASPDLRRLCS